MTQQVEDVQGVAPIGLRFADDHGANLRGIADEQRVFYFVSRDTARPRDDRFRRPEPGVPEA